jgi:hypothetical protein
MSRECVCGEADDNRRKSSCEDFRGKDKLPDGILIEAEDFESYGGWVLDSQFEVQMGSPYLMAHGLGRPVEDATTTVVVDAAGDYEVWVRAKDWVPGYHPGQFALSVNGTRLETIFGANDQDWSWQSAGKRSAAGR